MFNLIGGEVSETLLTAFSQFIGYTISHMILLHIPTLYVIAAASKRTKSFFFLAKWIEFFHVNKIILKQWKSQIY